MRKNPYRRASRRSDRPAGASWLLVAISWGMPVLSTAQTDVREVPPLKAGISGGQRGPGGIVAIVNDDVITQAELEKRVDRRRADLARRYPASAIDREYARLAYLELEKIIDDKLILQLVRKDEEKEAKTFITELDVDQQILEEVDRLKGSGITSPEDFYRLARERDGDTREELRKFIKERLSIQSYLWRRVLTPNIFVSPQEARAYYRKHSKEFSTPEKITFRQIIIKMTRDGRAEELVDKVEKGIREGIAFEDLAKEFSCEALEGAPELAGHLITKTFEDLQHWKEPLPGVLKSMKKGQISERVVTSNSIHYFKVEDVQDGKPKPFSAVQEEIAKKIREARNSETLDNFLGKIRKRARIDVFLPQFPDAARLTKSDEKPGSKRPDGAARASPGPGEAPSAPAGEPLPKPPREGKPDAPSVPLIPGTERGN